MLTAEKVPQELWALPESQGPGGQAEALGSRDFGAYPLLLKGRPVLGLTDGCPPSRLSGFSVESKHSSVLSPDTWHKAGTPARPPRPNSA